METDFEHRLAAAKADNTLERLMRCGRLVNEGGLARLKARLDWPALRPAHMSLFPHIDLAGTRLTVLAERLHVSKQAVAPLVDDLVTWGALEKVPDPADGRARLIRFVTEGPYSLFAGLQALADYEAELAERMGPEAMAALRQGLRALDAALAADPG